MKCIKGINRTLNKFLSEYECMARYGFEFCYLHHKDLIYYNFILTEKGEEEFMESVNRLHPQVSLDIFLWSILHELGHHETLDKLTNRQSNQCEEVKGKIAEGIVPTKAYYDLPDEKMATEWAVRFANTHQKELETLWSELEQKLEQCYKINKITIDR